jgi:glycine/D-amino acid oxidase-like deaminating enzyme
MSGKLMSAKQYDAVVVGGGFFGCCVAVYLKKRMKKVLLVERERELFRRASYNNQARVHNGYHYPRSLQTAYRSHVNFSRFVHDFSGSVVSDFTKLYCIAGPMSKVTPPQFERFCNIIGAPWKPARRSYVSLFDPHLIASVYEVQEYAFDSNVLRDILRGKLDAVGVEVVLSTSVEGVDCGPAESTIRLSTGANVSASYLFNCTYANLKQIPGMEVHCLTQLKQEITEMALIEPPSELSQLGITVMCGPFFSVMPFPPRSLHTLSHVRYTPHASWIDSGAGSPSPYEMLDANRSTLRAEAMLRDAARYLPLLKRSRIRDSLFEVKTLLVRNEIDDGRPILIEQSTASPRVYSIMGGKLDNIYDVYQRLSEDGL